MENFEIPENPEYIEQIRKFETTDPGHADLFNSIIQALVNNETFLKKVAEQQAEALTSHLNNQQNPHGISKEQLELENVDNTTDAEKDVASATKDGDGNVITDTYEAKDYFMKGSFRMWLNVLSGNFTKTLSLNASSIAKQKYGYMFIRKKNKMEIVASQLVPIHLLGKQSSIVDSISLQYVIPYASYGQTSQVVATTLVMKVEFKGDNEVTISFSEERYLGSPSFIENYGCYFCTV